MAMMASSTSGNAYDEDNNILDDDFLNDGAQTTCMRVLLC